VRSGSTLFGLLVLFIGLPLGARAENVAMSSIRAKAGSLKPRRLLLPVIALAGALLLAGCGASKSAQSPATVTVTVARAPAAAQQPRRPPAIAQPLSLKTFDGSYFSVDYSGSWYVEADEADKGSYLDTTIRNSANPNVMLRIDVTPGAATGDPARSARQVEHALRSQPGYRLLDFSRIDFHGHPALRWEFEVNENGTVLRKVDIFFENDAGDGLAVLTQAPAATYALWRRLFEQTRASVAVTNSSVGTNTLSVLPNAGSGSTSNGPSPSAGASFCDTHACIANFDNGVGTIIQCADGMWSHSGGRPGACSYHGGVAGDLSDSSGTYAPDYGAGSGYTENYGNGNGYTVVCVDGTLSDSGGIQGACSHHGGVGG
jgi:hypothetical protein